MIDDKEGRNFGRGNGKIANKKWEYEKEAIIWEAAQPFNVTFKTKKDNFERKIASNDINI